MTTITVRAQLGNGVASCARVLNFLRTKGLDTLNFTMTDDTMTMNLPADQVNTMLAGLNGMEDVRVLA